jgi:hypothetical protein
MKKTILAICFILFCLSYQDSKAQAFTGEGDLQLNLGISLLPIGYNIRDRHISYRSTGFLPVTLNAEYGIHKYIGVGGYFGFYNRGYRHSFNMDDWSRTNYYSIGARATLHSTPIINNALELNIDEDAWDIYATVIAGYEIISHNAYNNGFRSIYMTGRPRYGITLGVRYMVTNAIGLFIEGGAGAFGLTSLGVTFKLK